MVRADTSTSISMVESSSTRGRAGSWPIRSMSLLSCVIVLLLHPTRAAALGIHQHPSELETLSKEGGRQLVTSYTLDYYSDPQLHWKTQMDSRTMDTGNVVEQSPFNDDILYITDKESHLTVMSATDGRVISVRKPETTSFNTEGQVERWTASCNSGIAFGEMADGTQFLAYSVVYQPPEEEAHMGIQTRVVAVSIPNHYELWSSNILSGVNMGSPVVYQTTDQQSYIALTHNADAVLDDNSTATVGHFSLIRADNGQIAWTESEWSREEFPQGYGPPGIAPNPAAGKYTGGEQNRNDLVVWANSDEEAETNVGSTFAFQLPTNFQGRQNEISNLASVILKKVRWLSVSRPVFGKDGKDMFMGVSGDQLRGWVGDNPFDDPANWASDLSTATENIRTAVIPTAPTLSIDGNRLFVSTSSSNSHCIDTKSGSRLWDVAGTSPFLAEARVSPDDERVYFIQSIDGRVYAFEQETGGQLWMTSCDAFEEDCSNSVKASFTISRSGQYLYYVDVLGKVIALKLGDLVENETPGGAVEEEEEATADPVGQVVEDPDETWLGSSISGEEPPVKSGPAIGGTIALIILAMLVALASGIYVMLVLRDKSKRKGGAHQRPKDDAPEADEVVGPDPYEDSLISKHDHSLLSEDTEPTFWLEENAEPSEMGSLYDECYQQPVPSNRFTKIMSGSNRVAPVPVAPPREDFSLGAAILV